MVVCTFKGGLRSTFFKCEYSLGFPNHAQLLYFNLEKNEIMCYYTDITDYFVLVDLKTTVVPCINVSILHRWSTQEVKKYNSHLWQVQHCDHGGLVIVPLDCRDPQLLPDHWVWSICTDLRTNEKKRRKRQRKKGDRSMKIHSVCVCDGLKLTRSFVWIVSPLANVTWTHGTDCAAWWGIGQAYFTTLDLYLTCTLSKSHGHKIVSFHNSHPPMTTKRSVHAQTVLESSPSWRHKGHDYLAQVSDNNCSQVHSQPLKPLCF